jgi:hypothetical protein
MPATNQGPAGHQAAYGADAFTYQHCQPYNILPFPYISTLPGMLPPSGTLSPFVSAATGP